jgi:amino acid adenylation domain-containing protein
VNVEFDGDLFDHAAQRYRPYVIKPIILSMSLIFPTVNSQCFAMPEAAAATRALRGSPASLPAEQLATLRQWNATEAAYPQSTVFSRLFEAQAARLADATAISCDGASLTYRQLNAGANRLAQALRDRGVGPGVCVGVCLERSPMLVLALLATLKSGGAYVPLDPQYPPQRLRYMLLDSGANLLVTTGAIAAKLELPEGCATLDPTALADANTEGGSNLESAAAPTDTAYVIYTSGSTGRPKGVMVSHGALLNLLWSMRERPGLKSTDVLVAVTTISFDIAALELYLPLLVGARIELASRETAADGLALSRLLETSGATVLQATPATWRMLLAVEWPGRPGLRAFCGGEALSRPLADALLGRVESLWNLYGPTETTIWSTAEHVEPGSGPISIGRPIANTRIHLLDAAGEPVPIGLVGEICIGGAGVAAYHGRPELTAERFLEDPDSAAADARLYRTGDLGRWGSDGRLYYLGRQDHQVKIRGSRIELGEIEAVLCGHTAVREALVVVGEMQPHDQRLIAYIVYRDGEDLTTSDMRRYLRRELPEFMVPSIIVPLVSMPLTPNGKLDRAALPDPFRPTLRAATSHEPPANGMERDLAEIWKSVLVTDRVGAQDNFFELGGYSLLALRVVEEVQQLTGYRLDPRALFFQSLRQVAALVQNPAAALGAPKTAP